MNGKELTVKDGVQIEKDVNNNRYSLVIPKINSTLHSGLLSIKATNPINTVTHEINIQVLGISENKLNETFYETEICT